MKKVRQGQTRWLSVLYEPGAFSDNPENHCAVVYMCRVTKVVGKSVYYNTQSGHPYIAHENWFLKNTHKTFRKAYRECQRMIDEVNWNNGY